MLKDPATESWPFCLLYVCETIFQLQKVTLQSQMFVCLSVCLSSICLSQKPLSLSESCLSAITCICHHVSGYQSLCQSAIIPLSHPLYHSASQKHNFWPSLSHQLISHFGLLIGMGLVRIAVH